MMTRKGVVPWVLLLATAPLGNVTEAVNIAMVTVGNPGNAGDTRYPSGGVSSFGAVSYAYNIGKFEVTAGQYTEFLNAVAATDTYGLYNPSMWSRTSGCKIQRNGSQGSYTYDVAADWAKRPVNFVSWGDATRFVNWLSNGQPAGMQTLATTEDGSYLLDGATSNNDLMAVTRRSTARYVIPTEDEWYKAAYHKNDGVTANYWDYPTRSDDLPSSQLIDPDPGNNATYYHNATLTIGAPYYRTEVGAHESSTSGYGTFDQAGNLREWNEASAYAFGYGGRGQRGESYNGYEWGLHASARIFEQAVDESAQTGFRVAEIPEPCTLLLALVSAIFTRRRAALAR